jgi:hypothetical protein
MAQVGSLAASAPATYSGTTITPTIVQSLANYLSGWFGIVIGANSPAIEDMNSLFFLLTYQLSYLFGLGVPEWDSGTTYFIGSIVQDGSGNLYKSLTNTNLNNALSSSTNWLNISGGVNIVAINPATQTPYAMATSDNNKTFLVNSANGAMQFNLPAPVINFNFKIKDVGGNFNINACTFHRHSTENFAGLAADYVATAANGEWQVVTDGTNWFITGR